MAMIQCEECGTSKSSKAPVCPACGYDAGLARKRRRQWTGFWIYTVILVVGVIWYMATDKSPTQTAGAAGVEGLCYENDGKTRTQCRDAVQNVKPTSVADHSIKNASYGCKSRDYRGRLTRYLVDGDQKTFKKALLLGSATGECKIFDLGQEVYLEDTAILSGLVCVRPKGSLDCFWTNMEAIH